MKHRSKAGLLCAVLAVAMLSGCGGSESSVVPADAVSSLRSQLTFTDEMTEKDKTGACTFYGVDEDLVEDAAALVGSGATAENMSVWRATDKDAAADILEALTTFVDDWTEGYADYMPAEVPKLDSAVLEQQDETVVLCVTADNDGALDAVQALLGR